MILERVSDRLMRRGSAIGVVVLLALPLAACSDPRPPRSVPTPDVVWEGGPPDGPLEADPWVQVVRAGILAQANAWNVAVFTDDALTDLWAEDVIFIWADRSALSLELGSPDVQLGPTPFTPLEVQVGDDQKSALVVGCRDSTPEEGTRPQGRTRDDRPHAYWLERDAEGDMRILGAGSPGIGFALEDGRELTEELCADVPTAQGRFDPVPSLDELMKLDGDDVIAPPKPTPSVTPIELGDRL